MLIKNEIRLICHKIKKDRQKAEWYLLFADIEREKYYEQRRTYIAGGNNEEKLYNPTEHIAVRGLEFDQASESYKWLRAVKFAENDMSSKEKIFLRARRKAAADHGRTIGRPGWVICTQQIYYESAKNNVRGNCWLSEDQVKRQWRKMVLKVADIAVRL